MKLLFISTFLDSPIHCNRAPYNEQLIDRLSEDMDIQVIRPISWIDWLSYITNRRHKKKSIPRKKSILTSYPILFYIPYLGTRINGFLYFLSIFILSFNKVRNADALYVSWLYPYVKIPHRGRIQGLPEKPPLIILHKGRRLAGALSRQ